MGDPGGVWDSTLTLLTRARGGDSEALNDLFARHLPTLRHWATGRLPTWARNAADTQDIIQDTLICTVQNIASFEHRGPGALQAYLRQAVMNRIRDHLRRSAARVATVPVGDTAQGRPDSGPSPFESAVAVQLAERYDAALQTLTETDRDLIVARVELQLTYAELAAATGRPSADAARVAVSRALVRLAEAMIGSDPVAG